MMNRHLHLSAFVVVCVCFFSGCGDASSSSDADSLDSDVSQSADAEVEPVTPDLAAQTLIEAVPESEQWELDGLEGPVQVVRTEMGVPHIYAASRNDMGRVLGFLVARDRFFTMDLQRRLAKGTLSEMLGELTLGNDVDSRLTGMTWVTERLHAALQGEDLSYVAAFAAGINAYISRVTSGELPPPSELELVAPLLGAESAAALMAPFDASDIAAMLTVIMYETNFETGDVARTARQAGLSSLFDGAVDGELRSAGILEDIWGDLSPIFPVASTPGWGVWRDDVQVANELPEAAPDDQAARAPRPAHTLVERAASRADAFALRLGRRRSADFGSNTWAVSAAASSDGKALVAGDGHLPLSVPALMYQVGLDTRVYGGGDIEQAGLLMTSLPVLAVGTNGHVAWSQVNPVADIVDWYAEEVTLDTDGRPASTLYQGQWQPLVAVEEAYHVADVPLLGSVGRTETQSRFTTFDGRFIFDIEGAPVVLDEEGTMPIPDQALLFGAQWIVPGDVDGDGIISAVSFDYTAFDASSYVHTLERFGHARDVESLRQMTRGLVGSMLYMAAADQAGDILFTSYQAVPCRGYLARSEAGGWAPGADPTMLLDGTTYGGFSIPSDGEGRVDEAPGESDPYRCVIPFDATPQSTSPEQGYLVNANNQPAPIQSDGRLDDDGWYMGGPWSSVRADSIASSLETAIAEGWADMEGMSQIQAHRRSRLGELFTPYLLQALALAESAAADTPLGGLQVDNDSRLTEVAARLELWAERGFDAASGVETFYHVPGDHEDADAVATMIFNAWLPRAIALTFGDEGMGGAWPFSSSRGSVKAMRRFLQGRGEDNPDGLASWSTATGESVFFDVQGTPELETSDFILVRALLDALDWLSSPPLEPGVGGFGTDQMGAWLWGLRHQVRFESIMAQFIEDGSGFELLLDLFSISTELLPLGEDLAQDDARKGIKWFPRGGDNYSVDAASPGFSGTAFTHGSGPVMRMVIALDGERVSGRNIIPGGQSALTDSPHFADQASLWLANETLPLRFHLDDVLAGAVSRESYTPVD